MNKITGLSVLIPIYNFDIRSLVKELSRQASLLEIPVEILCVDDKSTVDFLQTNKEVSSIPFVRYIEENINRGRSAIRNHLANLAQYDYLIFLDCDSEIVSPSFLTNYISEPDYPVKIGGTAYSSDAPSEKEYFLHWLNGSQREVKTAAERMLKPYRSLTLNNIYIEKDLYQNILLDEKITGYGHEDTKFGFDLMNMKIEILHIDNPVRHIGLNNNENFISKTRESVQNLYQISQRDSAVINTKLFKTTSLLKRTGSHWIVSKALSICQPFILKNLKSNKPSLFALDLLKLSDFLAQKKK